MRTKRFVCERCRGDKCTFVAEGVDDSIEPTMRPFTGPVTPVWVEVDDIDEPNEVFNEERLHRLLQQSIKENVKQWLEMSQ